MQKFLSVFLGLFSGKMRKTYLLLPCILLVLFAFKLPTSDGIRMDTPDIVAGKAKITGRIMIPDNKNTKGESISFGIPNPISGQFFLSDITLDSTGYFSYDFEIETDTAYIYVFTSVNPYKQIRVKTTNGSVNNIEISYDTNLNFEKIEVTPIQNQYDLIQGMEVIYKMIEYMPKRPYPRLFDKSIDEFIHHNNRVWSERVSLFVNTDSLLSPEFKRLLSKDFSLYLYVSYINEYESEMIRNYRNATQDTVNTPDIQKIDRTYFRFLKDFNFNDPQYLHTILLPEFLLELLRNEVLELPQIGETEISDWLENVKPILSDLVGFEEGQFYDILAANAYARQLNEEGKPLSTIQKNNIKHFWEDGEIQKILFRKNDHVIKLNQLNTPAVIHDVQSVAPEKVIDEILSKFKDKVVFIDFWATWCGPCLDAMKIFREAKADFYEKDVVFVYLTNSSSPIKLWEEKIKGIGSNHYYLTDEQWVYLMDEHDFSGIPSYLLYSKKGELSKKFTGYPGNDAVVEMINSELNK